MDQQAFISLFLRHQADLRAFVLSVVRDWNRTDDIIQEVSLVLWQRIGDYDPTYSFGAWARGIAAKKILQERSRWQRSLSVLSPEAIAALDVAFEDGEHSTTPQIEAIQQCLGRFNEQGRLLVELRYRDGLPLDEIARRMQRGLSSVTMALLRLRGALERCVRIRLRHAGGES